MASLRLSPYDLQRGVGSQKSILLFRLPGGRSKRSKARSQHSTQGFVLVDRSILYRIGTLLFHPPLWGHRLLHRRRLQGRGQEHPGLPHGQQRVVRHWIQVGDTTSVYFRLLNTQSQWQLSRWGRRQRLRGSRMECGGRPHLRASPNPDPQLKWLLIFAAMYFLVNLRADVTPLFYSVCTTTTVSTPTATAPASSVTSWRPCPTRSRWTRASSSNTWERHERGMHTWPYIVHALAASSSAPSTWARSCPTTRCTATARPPTPTARETHSTWPFRDGRTGWGKRDASKLKENVKCAVDLTLQFNLQNSGCIESGGDCGDVWALDSNRTCQVWKSKANNKRKQLRTFALYPATRKSDLT